MFKKFPRRRGSSSTRRRRLADGQLADADSPTVDSPTVRLADADSPTVDSPTVRLADGSTRRRFDSPTVRLADGSTRRRFDSPTPTRRRLTRRRFDSPTVRLADGSTRRRFDSPTVRLADGSSRRRFDLPTVRLADGSTRRRFDLPTVRLADGSTRRRFDSPTVRLADGLTRRRFDSPTVDSPTVDSPTVRLADFDSPTKKREFIARIDEIKMCQPGEQNKLAKDLGISEETFCCWKKEFGLPVNSQIIYSESEKKELMEKYYKIKQRNLKISESDIANILNIPRRTLYGWKKKFVNSIDENSLPDYADNDTSKHSMPSSDDKLWVWNLAKKKRTEKIEVENSVKK
uniref:Uncharacterized protein n=1 Tax=Globodera rostochiensis TaxID=31243 RepID=A0A914H8U1_GLORO